MQEELNAEQKIAAEHIEGPALVVAGAGSGKTRVVTLRIIHLIKTGVPASEILAVTFTNKAAGEMRERIEKLARHFVLTCTFHSLCAKILRESIGALGYSPDFTIYDEDDSFRLLKECFAALHLSGDKGALKAKRREFSTAKNNLTELNDPVFMLYQQKLKQYQALDFDDLLFLTVKLFREHPDILERYQRRWSFILIDEYQDTNLSQHAIIQMLSARHHNVFAVGDPDQSIYSWRGANVSNILNFEKDFPGARIISLEQNYRSRTTILNAANALIRHNTGRYQKQLWSSLGPGEKVGLCICENEHAEADFVVKKLQNHHQEVALKECVIFYRTNFQSRLFEDVLMYSEIPYVIIGGLSFYQRREIKDIVAILRIVLGGSDFVAFSRTINLPKRGIGEATLNRLQTAAMENSLSIFDACIAVLDHRIPIKISPRQENGLKAYTSSILALRKMVEDKVHLSTLISETIEQTQYLDYLREDPETYEERRGNLAELVSKAAESEKSLPEFLEEMTLRSATDELDADGTEKDAVRLMTLHTGKGLEFNVVFLVGMEEDLFPHINAKEDADRLEEERRLCYVGMTRAKEHLYLTACRSRFLWGTSRTMYPSRFLSEIPAEFIKSSNNPSH